MSNANSAARSPRKITHSAPAPPIANASAMRGVMICRTNAHAKPAAMTGTRVKTAAAATGGAVLSPSNMSTK